VGRLALLAGLVALCATYLWEAVADVRRLADRSVDPLYACAQAFRSVVPPDALIVASGGICTLPGGHPTAGNKPYMFYWLDAKGFNLCEDAQSLDALDAFAARGATFFVAEKAALGSQPGFEDALRHAFPVVAECDAALVLRLSRRTPDPTAPDRRGGTGDRG